MSFNVFSIFVLVLRRILVSLISNQKSQTINLKRSNQINFIYNDYLTTDLKISILKCLPLKILSRIWGFIHSIYLPIFLRHLVIGLYSIIFKCYLEEANVQDFKKYSNLNQFFRRSLKPGLRIINPGSNVVCPSDGTLLHFGKVINGQIEQVKGINFSLRAFLGPQIWSSNFYSSHPKKYQKSLLLKKKNTCLYSSVIYLAPGDYHRFHSPVEWKVKFTRHFSGELLSVQPMFLRWIRGVLSINERVTYIGEWIHGFFSMTAVGATNVGSVITYFDPSLQTNKSFFKDNFFKDNKLKTQISFKKGQPFGEFNLGSTIVLIFEAPINSKFNFKINDRVKYGQLLCQPG